MQESRPDTWDERIRWIVDTHETGATESERMGKAAEKLGVSREAVRLMYKGRSTPGGDTLAAIIRAYPRVNPTWLLTGKGSPERPPKDHGDPYLAGQIAVLQRLVDELSTELMRLHARQSGATGHANTKDGAEGSARS